MNPADKYPPPKFFDIDETSPFYPVGSIVINAAAFYAAFALRFDSRSMSYVDSHKLLASFIVFGALFLTFVFILGRALRNLRDKPSIREKYVNIDFLTFAFWILFCLLVGIYLIMTVCFSTKHYTTLRSIAGLGPASGLAGMLPGLFAKLAILILITWKKRKT